MSSSELKPALVLSPIDELTGEMNRWHMSQMLESTIDEAVKDESVRNIALSDELVQKCFDSNDYKEGRKAFMEKRKPVFTGT